jgi:hypothetical protein
MRPYQYEIKREAVRRGVSRLYHFTPAWNARSILCNGLASREVLQQYGVDFFITDSMRLDNHLGTVSVSIHSINESMFSAKTRNSLGEFLIFELNASILWTHNCRFCWKNAASSELRKHTGFLGGPWAFAKMFEDRPVSHIDGRSCRSIFQIQNCEPTDNSAEVQVFDPIDTELIVRVIVRTQRVKDGLEALMQEIDQQKPVVINEEVFR